MNRNEDPMWKLKENQYETIFPFKIKKMKYEN